MQNHETDTKTLIEALRILADNIITEDGVANATILEGADRIEKLLGLVGDAYYIIEEFNTKSKWKEKWLLDAEGYGAKSDV